MDADRFPCITTGDTVDVVRVRLVANGEVIWEGRADEIPNIDTDPTLTLRPPDYTVWL